MVFRRRTRQIFFILFKKEFKKCTKMSDLEEFLNDFKSEFDGRQFERIFILQREYPKIFDEWFNQMTPDKFIDFLKNLKIMQVLSKVFENSNDDFDELYTKIKKFFKKCTKEPKEKTTVAPEPTKVFAPAWRKNQNQNQNQNSETVWLETLNTFDDDEPPMMVSSDLFVPIIQQHTTGTNKNVQRCQSIPPLGIRPDTPKHLRPRCASTSSITTNQNFTVQLTDSEFERLMEQNKNINENVQINAREIYRKTTITPCSTPVSNSNSSIVFRKLPSVVERSHTPADGRYGCKLCKQIHQRKSYETGSVTCTKQGTALQVILSFLKDIDFAPLYSENTWRCSRIEDFKCIKAYERFFSIILPTDSNDNDWIRLLRKRAFETRTNRWVSCEGTLAELAERGILEQFSDPVLRDRPQVKRRREIKQEAMELGIVVETRGKKKKIEKTNEDFHDDDEELAGLLI